MRVIVQLFVAEIYRNYWLTSYFKLELPAPEWSLSRCIMGNLGSDVSRAWLILEITIQGVSGIFLVSSQTLSILNGWNAPLVILPVLKIFNHFSNTALVLMFLCFIQCRYLTAFENPALGTRPLPFSVFTWDNMMSLWMLLILWSNLFILIFACFLIIMFAGLCK